jgi:hypothetical protein
MPGTRTVTRGRPLDACRRAGPVGVALHSAEAVQRLRAERSTGSR